jgi:hypothetical protein
MDTLMNEKELCQGKRLCLAIDLGVWNLLIYCLI